MSGNMIELQPGGLMVNREAIAAVDYSSVQRVVTVYVSGFAKGVRLHGAWELENALMYLGLPERRILPAAAPPPPEEVDDEWEDVDEDERELEELHELEELREENARLRAKIVTAPKKKRGPGRPQGSKNTKKKTVKKRAANKPPPRADHEEDAATLSESTGGRESVEYGEPVTVLTG